MLQFTLDVQKKIQKIGLSIPDWTTVLPFSTEAETIKHTLQDEINELSIDLVTNIL